MPFAVMNLKFGLLVSGELGFQCLLSVKTNYNIRFVLTDKKSKAIITYCEENEIALFQGNPRSEAINEFLAGVDADIILSINYLFIVDERLIKFPKLHAINFHGSLLPKYRGRTPHVWAIINNETETGITAHLMTENCDEGNILYQERIYIEKDTTGGELLKKFFSLYPIIVDKVISGLLKGDLVDIPQDNSKATYFGKRSPEDGLIDFEWSKERIHNWVRAQAKPYPGAFFHYNSIKVEVHKVLFSDMGFNWEDANGLILNDSPLIVKTVNGAIILEDIKSYQNIHFKIGDLLDGRH